jgi:hypothetical protein
MGRVMIHSQVVAKQKYAYDLANLIFYEQNNIKLIFAPKSNKGFSK